jgi:sulfite exporter TauE/SafE/copper chaperone CopZ
MTQIITWNVTGMTCHSCERLITNVLKDVPGVKDVEVSLKQNRAGVEMNDGARDPDLDLLNKQLAAHNYVLIPEDRTAPKKRNIDCELHANKIDKFSLRLKRAATALALVGLASVVILGPLHRLIPSVSAGASIGAMVLLGLVASVSSCLATTGGFILAYNGKPRTTKQLISVHIGRLVTFLAGGAFLGAIGGSLPAASTGLSGVLALALGMLFLLMGLNMLDLTPSLARLGLTLPGSVHKLADRVSASNHALTPFLFGAVTFVLPCGFTQTAQALAIASGSVRSGMLLMGAFALGTIPVLAGISAFGSASALKHRAIRLATGAVLALFAVSQINGGLTILGSPVTPGTLLTGFSQASTNQANGIISGANDQVVKMIVNYGTYNPNHLTVRKGIPVRWEIDGQDVSGCASPIVVPSYGIRRNLNTGLNVITFTPTKTGTIPFSCGMGMIRGSFTVTD